MKTSISAALAATALLFVAFQPANASTTYYVDFDFGTTMNLSGTIDTDGTEGYLTDANISGWNLTWTAEGFDDTSFFKDGGGTLVQYGYADTYLGQGFVATSTDISINFDVSSGAFLYNAPSYLWFHADCNATALLLEDVPLKDNVCWRKGTAGYGSFFVDGAQRIGTVSAVPLPATLPLMLVGLAGLGWFGRRRTSRHDQDLAGHTA